MNHTPYRPIKMGTRLSRREGEPGGALLKYG